MNELIKIEQSKISNEEVNAVSARDLWNKLELKRDFSTWVKDQIKRADLILDSDYISFPHKEERQIGATIRTEYVLTLDAAKNICMMSQSDKGKEIRRYFIECEKQLRELQPKLPTTYKEALQSLLIEVERNESLQLENTAQKQIIGELQPIVDYTNEILKASGSVTITQIAKDYGLSGAKLNKILHDEGVQYKQSGQWLLYSQFHNLNYTESKTTQFKHKDGSQGIRVSTKWKQLGRLFIHDLLKKRKIKAVIEREGEK